MGPETQSEYLKNLVLELCKLPAETEWVEFKHNNDNPEEIGKYISALSNSAVLAGKSSAFMVWGISNDSHEIIGTQFDPKTQKKGSEELESWLLRLLEPKIDFQFHSVIIEEKRVVVLEINQAYRHPVRFSGSEYIRIGSYKKELRKFPEKERQLWRAFDQTPFEKMNALDNVSADHVLDLIDYSSYFSLQNLPIPEGHISILNALESDQLIRANEAGTWSITNLGAILFAKNLTNFSTLNRKSTRVIVYNGTTRIQTKREQVGVKGYAVGFEGLIGYIDALLPTNEVLGSAIRKDVPMYPQMSIREIIANALIHQDFLISGTGPLVEIFDDRFEVTNPGTPLVETFRLLDSPPRSRNEALASFMRRIGICEERGSGIDKIVFESELYQLPAPEFDVTSDHTKVILFAPRPLSKMDAGDRIRACYLHACLKYVSKDYLTNTSIRERFGIEEANKAMASRIIRDAVDANMIKPYDDNAAKKMMKYVPFWA